MLEGQKCYAQRKDDKMRGKLSAFYYVKNNKRRVCLLIITFGLYMAMIYCIGVLLESSKGTMDDTLLKQSERFQIISLNEGVKLESGITETELRAKVEEIILALSEVREINVKQAVACEIIGVDIRTVFGTFDIATMFLSDKETLGHILEYDGVELTSGRMPKEEGEIVVGETYARNMGKKPAYGGDEPNPENLISIQRSNTYKIVGTVKHTSGEACYLISGIRYKDALPMAILLFSDGVTVNGAGDITGISYLDILKNDINFKKYIDNGIVTDYMVDYTTRQKQYADIMISFDNITTIIKSLSTAIVFLGLIVMFNLYMNDRRSEWCLYNSIGHSSKDIYFLIVRELLIILGFALLVGTLGFIVFSTLFGKLILEPLGLTTVLFVPEGIKACISILVIFFGILQISVYYAIQRIKTVDAIDDSFI